MNTSTRTLVLAALTGQLVGLLGYVEQTYFLLVLVAPLVTGAIAAARRWPLAPVAVMWASAGINMLWIDWVFLGEDVLYHLVLSVLMALLSAGGYGIARVVARLGGRTSPRATQQQG